MTNTSMSTLERQRLQGAITGVMDVWIYDGPEDPHDPSRWAQWAQSSMTMKDVQERIHQASLLWEWELKHLVTPDGGSHLVLAGPNLLDDFRRFLKDRASSRP